MRTAFQLAAPFSTKSCQSLAVLLLKRTTSVKWYLKVIWLWLQTNFSGWPLKLTTLAIFTDKNILCFQTFKCHMKVHKMSQATIRQLSTAMVDNRKCGLVWSQNVPLLTLFLVLTYLSRCTKSWPPFDTTGVFPKLTTLTDRIQDTYAKGNIFLSLSMLPFANVSQILSALYNLGKYRLLKSFRQFLLWTHNGAEWQKSG